jgi:hypothetical protein
VAAATDGRDGSAQLAAIALTLSYIHSIESDGSAHLPLSPGRVGGYHVPPRR